MRRFASVALLLASAFSMSARSESGPSLNEVTVRASTAARGPDWPSAIGAPLAVDLDRGSSPGGRLDRILVDVGAGAWDAANSLGLAAGLSVRGFPISNQGTSQLQASRVLLNGHSDIAWRFARDPATVARIDLVSGHDATLLGAGSPGGALMYSTKQPTGAPFQELSFSADGLGGRRGSLDAEWHAGPLQWRTVLVAQRGERTVEGVKDERHVALLSGQTAWGEGHLKLELEYHQSRMPFPFGTAYSGGQFWFDVPLVDPRARANRQYHRYALYVQQPLGPTIELTGYWQRAHSTRDESLLGFFDAASPGRLRGYYREIDESNGQHDAGLTLRGRRQLGDHRHEWTLALQHFGLARDFSGPQNIGGFLLDLPDPVFPLDVGALALSPRQARERYQESGLAFADTVQWRDWSLRAGIRQSRFKLDASNLLTTPPSRASDARHTTASFGLGYRIDDHHRLWFSRAESFLPNRGRQSDGNFLPPSEGRQHELGWAWSGHAWRGAVALFDLRQTQLPGRDPTNPDALRVIGTNRSRGIELQLDAKAAGIDWSARLTRLRARVQDPVTPGQGHYLTGVPDTYGALRASRPVAGFEAWASVQFASSRPGDDRSSFTAPGHAVLNLGLKATPTPDLRWGVELLNALDRRYVRALTGPDNVWQGPRATLRAWASLTR